MESKKNKKRQYSDFLYKRQSGKKNIIALILSVPIVLLMISIISCFMDSREELSKKAETEIMEKWGPERKISAPIIESKTERYLPISSNIDIKANAEIRYRGIYKCAVYSFDAAINSKYKVARPGKLKLKIANRQVKWHNVIVNGKKIDLKTSADFDKYSYIELETTRENEDVDIFFGFSGKGTKKITVFPSATENNITISSNWNSPSFQGDYLPESHKITDKAFTATWNISEHAKADNYSKIEVEMFVPLNSYALVNRTMSYAFLLLIIYTFSLFMAEYFSKKNIHIIQYVIASLTPIMFYLLLLSISEHLSFGLSFLISATMSSVLIALYIWGIYKTKKIAWSILATNTIAYSLIFILLTRENYALITGAIILFGILSITMATTTKLKVT